MANSKESLFGTLKLVFNVFVHMLIAVVFLFVIYYAVVYYRDYDNVKLHVVFQTFGYQFCMMEAIMTFQAENSWSSLLSRKYKRWVHLVLQVIGSSFILVGFALAITFKEQFGNPHFATVHGVLGLVSFILTMLSVMNGFGAFLLKPGQTRSTGVKLLHTLTGTVAIILGLVCIILGMNKATFIRDTGHTLYIVGSIFVAICIAYIIIRPILNMWTYMTTLRNAS